MYRLAVFVLLLLIGWAGQCFAFFLPAKATVEAAVSRGICVEQILVTDCENRTGKFFLIGYECAGADGPGGESTCRVKWVCR